MPLIGKLVVGQSGGCTHVINATLAGVIERARSAKAITAVWGAHHGVEGILRRDFLDLRAESPATIKGIRRVPAAALGSCRHKLTESDAADVINIFRRNEIRYFVYIGGNDSADTSHRIAAAAAKANYDLRVVAAPKTIDNDLPCTDHCPGYGSAAKFIASTTADVGMETEAMHTVEPVKVVEVMGRNAGWLPCASVLAKRSDLDAPHIVWPPEIPFDRKKFLTLVAARLKNPGWCVAVISETLRDESGRPVAAGRGREERDAFGHPRLTDAARYLCELVAEELKVRARWDKPGTIQRMASAYLSEPDVAEAYECGASAVKFALAGRSDEMVIMRRRAGRGYAISYDTVPLARIANTEKLLPASYFDRKSMLPTAAFRRYAEPIIGPGLPAHPRFRHVPPPIQD